MLEHWNEKGYERLGLTGQNLRDQASRLQKKRDCSINTAFLKKERKKDEDNEGEYAINQPKPRPNLHSRASHFLEDFRNKELSRSTKVQPNLPDFDVLPSQIKEKPLGNSTYENVCKEINFIYE